MYSRNMLSTCRVGFFLKLQTLAFEMKNFAWKTLVFYYYDEIRKEDIIVISIYHRKFFFYFLVE